MVTLLRKTSLYVSDFLTTLSVYHILDEDERVAIPKRYEDHFYSLPNSAPAVAKEPVDAAVQVGGVSLIIFNL